MNSGQPEEFSDPRAPCAANSTPPDESGLHGGLDRWFPVVYAELRRLASSYLRKEPPGQTLQTTSLVHEAYIRLLGQHSVGWHDRRGFFAAAATSMRRILVDRARARHAEKRGGRARRVPLDEAVAAYSENAIDLVELGSALDRLTVRSPTSASVVEMRFFLGFSVEETATLLGMSPRTVAREWNVARAWLLGELEAVHGGRGTRAPIAGEAFLEEPA